MGESKHTDGPWTACFLTVCGEVEGFHISGRPYGSTAPICEARYAGFAPQLEANARLIAAAPDLYVIATHPVLEHLIATSDHPSVKAIFEPMRRAALAKATGA